MKINLGRFLVLVALCGYVAYKNPLFLSPTNLQNVARLIGIIGIYSIGLGLIIITSGIDLSVGAVFALLGVLLSLMLTAWGVPSVLAVLAIIGLAMTIGAFHSVLITRVRIQPFIVTLCGLLVYRSMARVISGDATKGFGSAEGFETLRNLATGSLFKIPTPFVLLIVISIIMWVVLHRSVYGRYLFAVGRNEMASRYSGINAKKIISVAYIISGALTGTAAILFAFYTNSISPVSHGVSYELYGIAAAVLGGCSLRGGEGSIIGILIGAAQLQVLRNANNLLGYPSSIEDGVMGVVILLGVIVPVALPEIVRLVRRLWTWCAGQFLQRRAAR